MLYLPEDRPCHETLRCKKHKKCPLNFIAEEVISKISRPPNDGTVLISFVLHRTRRRCQERMMNQAPAVSIIVSEQGADPTKLVAEPYHSMGESEKLTSINHGLYNVDFTEFRDRSFTYPAAGQNVRAKPAAGPEVSPTMRSRLDSGASNLRIRSSTNGSAVSWDDIDLSEMMDDDSSSRQRRNSVGRRGSISTGSSRGRSGSFSSDTTRLQTYSVGRW